MQSHSLGRIDSGVSAGIEIVQNIPRHGRIDPAKYTREQLLLMTNPIKRGSKWLVGVSLQDEFDLIR